MRHMARAPRKKPSPADALCRAIDARVADLRQKLPRALAGETDAIHQSRVTTRRLKAAVDLLRPSLPDESRREFARGLRRLRRTLGPLRDLDVMQSHAAELTARRYAAAGEWLGQRLCARRVDALAELSGNRKAPQQLLRKLARGLDAWASLGAAVVESQVDVRKLVRDAAVQQLDAFAARAEQLTRSRDDSSEQPGAAPAGDVHELRIAGKLLRYTMEWAEPAGLRVPAAVLKSFKKLQDALGLWHDHVVLGERALSDAHRATVALHDSRLYGQVLELARETWRRSERHIDKFASLWHGGGGQSITRTIAEVFCGATAAADERAAQSSLDPVTAAETQPVPQAAEEA
jgi:CHAD domain-containing protein